MSHSGTTAVASPEAGEMATSAGSAPFDDSRACFEDIAGWLEGAEAASLPHAELEDDLDRRGRELLRRLLQDHLDLRAQREQRVEVVGAGGAVHGSVEAGHCPFPYRRVEGGGTPPQLPRTDSYAPVGSVRRTA